MYLLIPEVNANVAENVSECTAFGGYSNPPPIPRSLHERILQTRTTTSAPRRCNTRGRMP